MPFWEDLGLIHTRHFDAQYCNKKIFLSHGCLRAKGSWQKNKSRYINKTQIKVCFLKNLPWLVKKNVSQNYLFNLYIFIAILCAKMSRWNKALTMRKSDKIALHRLDKLWKNTIFEDNNAKINVHLEGSEGVKLIPIDCLYCILKVVEAFIIECTPVIFSSNEIISLTLFRLGKYKKAEKSLKIIIWYLILIFDYWAVPNCKLTVLFCNVTFNLDNVLFFKSNSSKCKKYTLSRSVVPNRGVVN